MKALVVACSIVLLTFAFANADVKPPLKPSDQGASTQPKYILHTGLEITTDPKAYEAKLQISQSQLQNFRAAIDGNSPIVGGIAFSPARTIIAGMLMFLAISIAGILIARSSSFGRTQKAVAAVVLLAVMIGAAAIITRANAGPPGSYRWRNLPQALAKGESTTGGVDIEVVPDDQLQGRMRLIMPLKKQTAPGEE